MQKLGKTLLAILIVVVVGYMGFDYWNTVSIKYNYRITINVKTPDGIKSGSTVRRVETNPQRVKLFELPEVTTAIDAIGEAVVIDLGNDKYMFGLIDSGSYQELFQSFDSPYGGGATYKSVAEYYNKLPVGSKANLPRLNWPQMVAFKDIDDPKTVYRLDKDTIDSVVIEIIDESVTRKIQSILPWLYDLKEKRARLNGSTSIAIKTNKPSDNLGAGNFSTGE